MVSHLTSRARARPGAQGSDSSHSSLTRWATPPLFGPLPATAAEATQSHAPSERCAGQHLGRGSPQSTRPSALARRLSGGHHCFPRSPGVRLSAQHFLPPPIPLLRAAVSAQVCRDVTAPCGVSHTLRTPAHGLPLSLCFQVSICPHLRRSSVSRTPGCSCGS